MKRLGSKTLLACVLLFFQAALQLRADQIEMQNGDRYVGRLMTFTNDTLVIQSDLLGTIVLPRSKVAVITLGAGTRATASQPAVAIPTNTHHSASAGLARSPLAPTSGLALQGADTNSIQQIQQQFLRDAGPEANKKFNDMIAGFLSGKLSVSDIRAEAESAAKQLRAMKRDLGNDADADSALDGYLSILDNFLRDTQTSAPSTNTSRALTKPGKLPPKETSSKEEE